MLRICTICARGGSKGVPDKNIRPILGKPLIAYSVEQALESGLFQDVAVSSDSDAILDAARDAGAHHLVKRPVELASDTSSKLPAIQHCVSTVEEKTGRQYEIMVDLDATSPLRNQSDIAGAVSLQEAGNCSNVITGCTAHRSPYFNLVEETAAGFIELSKPGTGIVRRQDSPRCFDCNASIYVWPRSIFFQSDNVLMAKTKLYEMPPERSWDIDSEFDFQIVKHLMHGNGSAPGMGDGKSGMTVDE